MLRDVEMHNAPTVIGQQHHDEQDAAGECHTVKKSIDAAEAT
jgi:hypothetical protein